MSLQYQYPHHQRSSGTPSDFSDMPLIFPPEANNNNNHAIGVVINELDMMPPHPPPLLGNNNDVNNGSTLSSSRDSGISSTDVDNFVDKFQLDKQCASLLDELKTVAKLTEDFYRDVTTERETCSDLLAELERKIRPFLIKLDEQIGRQESVVKRNLYKCQITDCRVTWLLKYNHFALEFRRLVEQLNVGVYDELERMLRLKTRGCTKGVTSKSDLHMKITRIKKELDQLDTGFRSEMAKSEASYEQDALNGSRRSY